MIWKLEKRARARFDSWAASVKRRQPLFIVRINVYLPFYLLGMYPIFVVLINLINLKTT